MKPFVYTYHDQEHQATVEHFSEGFANKFRIYTTKETLVIDPVNHDKTIWLQSDGARLPYDLIQAIGEGLEAGGIIDIISYYHLPFIFNNKLIYCAYKKTKYPLYVSFF